MIQLIKLFFVVENKKKRNVADISKLFIIIENKKEAV